MNRDPDALECRDLSHRLIHLLRGHALYFYICRNSFHVLRSGSTGKGRVVVRAPISAVHRDRHADCAPQFLQGIEQFPLTPILSTTAMALHFGIGEM